MRLSIQVTGFIDGENLISSKSNCHQWSLPFGCEKCLPDLLLAPESGTKDIDLKLTTLEDVFLKTRSEEFDGEAGDVGNTQHGNGKNIDIELGGGSKDVLLLRAWEPQVPTYQETLFLPKSPARRVLYQNQRHAVEGQHCSEHFHTAHLPRRWTSYRLSHQGATGWGHSIKRGNSSFLSVDSVGVLWGQGVDKSLYCTSAADPGLWLTTSLARYLPAIGGIFSGNETLQYAPNVDGSALQIGVVVLANYLSWLVEEPGDGMSASVQQLPYLRTR